MRYQPSDPRSDDPEAVMKHKDKYKGGKALIVLGGYSAKNWEDIYAKVQPDVLIGANGANVINDLDYWIIAENMTRSDSLAKKDDKDSVALMNMFHQESGAKTKLVSHRSWKLLKDTTNCIRIRRQGYELDEIPKNFTFREYGMGYLGGWLLKEKEAGAAVHVGTVGLQCLHHAGILGCSEVHTIGYDLMFRDHEYHHWYSHPVYKIDRFRTPKAFTMYRGVPTLQAWTESAQFLKAIEWMFKRDGIRWIDHSDGLLKLEGLNCAM